MVINRTMVQPNDTLDLAISQRGMTFRFDLYDGTTQQQLGQIFPIADSTPTLTHDVTRTIKRTLNGLRFGLADSALLDPLVHRIKITAILGDGTTYPVGRYMFTDLSMTRYTAGVLASCTLTDEMFMIDQPLDAAFSANAGFDGPPPGLTVDILIERLLSDLTTLVIDLGGTQVNTDVATWPAGTSRAKVLTDLATFGGYFSPWFDNSGVLRFINSFDPAAEPITVDLDVGSRVVQASVVETSDVINAPNRFVVIDNSGTSTTAVTATYDVPSSAPHSIANRGFVVPSIINMQLGSDTQAKTVARTIGLSSTVYERVELVTPVDPRHDSYDVIRWRGVSWLELGWTMELAAGGSMRHTLRKAYVS